MYKAPEALESSAHDNRGARTQPVDLWALGVLLYTLCGGEPPFHCGRSRKATRTKIAKGRFEFHALRWSEFPADPQKVVRNLIVLSPLKRWTAVVCLKHGWVASEGAHTPSLAADRIKAGRTPGLDDAG